MSTAEAAEYLGVSSETVRRWIDAQEAAGRPVANRDRDASGYPIPGRHRRPYIDEVEKYRQRREVDPGDQGDEPADEPAGD